MFTHRAWQLPQPPTTLWASPFCNDLKCGVSGQFLGYPRLQIADRQLKERHRLR